LLVLPDEEPILIRVPNAKRKQVLEKAQLFYDEVSQLGENYLEPASELYQWLVKPLEDEIAKRQLDKVDNLLYIMPEGLRLVPVAALYDKENKQYVAQKYSTGFSPSLSLVDTRYRSIKDSPVLAFGASTFQSDQNQTNLPAVNIEVAEIAGTIRQGTFVLDSKFTLKNLQENRQNNPYPIIHLATHADFQPGDYDNSYIQLYDQKLTLDKLRTLGLDKPTVELLVISACRSAFGDREAELGFGGLAAQIGVKSVMASLWYVGDTGTLALMTEFYRDLSETPIKAEALRQAQVDTIEGRVKKVNGQIINTRGTLNLPEESAEMAEDLTHPFYWAPFVLIGNPW
jgi:CHAT domain-containing protein